MKKNLSVFFIVLAFIISCSVFFGYTLVNRAFAEEYKTESITQNLELKSKSAMLLDADSMTVLYSYNENDCHPIASMCKIMTLLLSFESIDNGDFSLDDTVTVSENAASMGGSQVFLEANAEYKVSDLIKSITVASANDACVAMAELISGSESAFVDKMNEKAREIDMNNTVFSNCTGLPKPDQHSCAKDVATMFSALIKHTDYFEFSKIWMDEISHPKGRTTEISNTNKLIRFYQGCDGGKTGYTSEAGHCLCASAIRNGLRLISVVISAPDSKTRFKEVSGLFDFGFSNYENKFILSANEPLTYFANVKGGKNKTVSVASEYDVKVLSRKNEKRDFEINFIPNNNVIAPITKGERVGVIEVYENGVLCGSSHVIAVTDVAERSYIDSIFDVIYKWSIVA